MKKIILFSVLSICMLMPVVAAPKPAVGETLAQQMAKEKKKSVVLCIGSDWCVAGEDVRKTFESASFRGSVGGAWLYGVFDRRETAGGPAVDAANARMKGLNLGTQRYPALFLFNPDGSCFARLENIPRRITAAELARQVQAFDRVRTRAEMAFANGRWGVGFDLLSDQAPGLFYHDKKKGWCARCYAKEWEKFRQDDPDDKSGWLVHFTMGNGLGDVTQANGLHEKPEEGKEFIKKLRARPQTHLTVVQKQSTDMAEFAFLRRDETKKEICHTLLRAIHDACPTSIWGWAARGYLREYGEDRQVPRDPAGQVRDGRGIVDLAVKSLGPAANPAKPGAAVRLLKREKALLSDVFATRDGRLSPRQQLALARVWLIHEVGTNTFDAVLQREGGRAFTKRMISDRTWMEDFLASGPLFNAAVSYTNLATFVALDKSNWTEQPLGRNFATAMALCSGIDAKRSVSDLFRTYTGYHFLADAGRLHKAAYTQDVREWRFALGRILSPNDLMYLNDFFNYTLDEYGGACWAVPYRLFNCFGESIHTPKYYRPWDGCDWPRRSLDPRVGGVCGALSTFGTLCANAHGVMATTGGQPGHCAYMHRRANHRWDIHNYVGRYTGVHNTFWGHAFTYLDTIERSYADREKQLLADRYTWLARLLEDAKVSATTIEWWYKLAAKTCPKHLGMWRAWNDWLARSKAAPDATRRFLGALARALPEGRQPTWDLANACLARLAELKGTPAQEAKKKGRYGRERVVGVLEHLYPLLPQPTNTPVCEEMDYRGVLNYHARLVGEDPDLRMRQFRAALKAQIGRPCFSEVLGWAADWYLKDSARAKDFVKTVASVCGSKKGTVCDFRGMMLAASKAGDVGVFQSIAALQDKLQPVPTKAERYPEVDFHGGKLLSTKGLLQTSSTSNWDHPELYARAIGPLKGPDVKNPGGRSSFHTAKEKSPWAIVQLPGAAQITGILVTNQHGQNSGRALPLEVFVSADGKEWTRVGGADKVQAEYRFPVTGIPRARYVKVAREPEVREDFFHVGKILVYGKKLY